MIGSPPFVAGPSRTATRDLPNSSTNGRRSGCLAYSGLAARSAVVRRQVELLDQVVDQSALAAALDGLAGLLVGQAGGKVTGGSIAKLLHLRRRLGAGCRPGSCRACCDLPFETIPGPGRPPWRRRLAPSTPSATAGTGCLSAV